MRVLTLDFETTNKDKGDALNKDNHIVLAVWHRSWDDKLTVNFGSEYEQKELMEDVRQCEVLVAHNAKFELQWLSRIDALPPGDQYSVFDTMLAEYVLAGNRRWSLDLGSMGTKYGYGSKSKLVSKWIEAGVCPSEIPKRLLGEYCIQDVNLTRKLYEHLSRELERLDLSHIHQTRCRTTQALADIELKGVTFDPRTTIQERDSAIQRYAELQAKLDALSGGLNWNSPPQIGKYIYGKLGFREATRADGKLDRTDAGNPRTDESTILKLRPTRPDQKEFLSLYSEFVPFKKRVQTLTKLGKACEENEGKVYAQFNQAVTQTHRLSSTGKKYKVQYQNIDRDLKRLVVSPHPDFYVAEADGVQLEFRGACELGHDPVALKDILDKKDIHKFSGSVIFNRDESEVVGEIRTEAKKHTFKPLYGGNSGTKNEKAYYRAFRERYKAIYQMQKKWTMQVLATGELVTEYGMRFYWPDTKMTESGYITNTPSIFNYPIQSFCTAEIIPLSLWNVWVGMRGWRSYLVNTVHDSILAYVHREEVDAFVELVKRAFTTDVRGQMWRHYGMDLRVPLGVEIKIGTFWGDDSLRSIKYDMEIKNNG